MRRHTKSGPVACMAVVKASAKKNKGIIIGFALVTFGMVILQNVVVIELIRYLSAGLVGGQGKMMLPFIGIFFLAYVTASVLKKVSALLRVSFSRNISMDVEQDFLRKYGDIRYRDYYFDPDQVLGQARGNGISAVGSWCELLMGIITAGITFLVSVIYLSSLHVLAVILCIVITGLFILVGERDNRKIPAIMEEFNSYMKEFYARQWEQIRNHKIAGFLNLDRVLAPYLDTTKRFMSNLKRMKIIFNRSILFATFGTDIVVLGATFLCTYLFSKSRLELSGILALILCVPNVSSTLFSVPQLRNSYEQSVGGMRALNGIYEKADGQKSPVVPVKAQRITEIAAENLSFHYWQQDKMVLQHFNLHLPCGIHLLKGPSGCGKSTFLRILAGELPVQAGTLRLGQQAISGDADVDFSEYVEYMSQIPVVVRGTVRDNILMGKPMDRERFERAVHNAGIEGLLAGLPDGEDSIISQDVLSSGEKQKIAIARVFYQEKPVWIFDEPTSALDPAAICSVMKGMEEYAGEKIILLSSHQPVESKNLCVHIFDNAGALAEGEARKEARA